MFQTHCYDAWLGGEARNSTFFMYSQLGGTFPAPLFLFLAGVSFALVTDKLLQKGLSPNQIAKTTIRRGAEIFGLGLLFRVQEFAVSLGWAPWSDLGRVDILNCIGVSMMLMGLMCWAVLWNRSETRRPGLPGPDGRITLADCRAERGWAGEGTRPYASLLVCAAVVTAAIALLAPLLWTTWRPQFLPWQLETYVNGVHNLGAPQSWLFPIFPWSAFAFAGLAFGFILATDRVKKMGAQTFVLAAISGAAFIYVSKYFDSRQLQLYPIYDYWHTSPNFFLIRVGMLLLLLCVAYVWCRWGLGQRGFSPLIRLGNTSLLVYWVHIEFVYGRFSILPRRSETIWGATVGLVIIFVSMLALSLVRTSLKTRLRNLSFWSSRARAT
jgi:uncharacterized membrane protein